MPFVTTDDDCEIYYETAGHGPALVFIAGFMGIARSGLKIIRGRVGAQKVRLQGAVRRA